jgi:lysophospholipid acyltransferase (LPLAT)-like uncharacterized protein
VSAEAAQPGAPPQGVVPHRLSWSKRLLAAGLYGLIRLVSATFRFRFEDRAGLFRGESPQPVIYCTWHNRLALAVMLFLKHPQRLQPTRRLAAMVSASRDGALVAHLLGLFGVEAARGSSSRRGPQALLELTTWAGRGYDLAIIPDGPRGPCYVVQAGVVSLAQLTRAPIVPVSDYARWKLRFKSWDRFQVPLPFSRVEVVFGEPIQVPRDLDDTQREQWRQLVEQRLRALTRD